MHFSLLQLTVSDLEAVAASRIPTGLEERLEPDALPPSFVASRSLRLVAQDVPAPWSTSFLIVRDDDRRIVGGCGFKSAPTEGQVEVGYGVAPAARGNGAASAALALLLERAFALGVTEVFAEIAPDNHASNRVVEKAGFRTQTSPREHDGEVLVRWSKRSEA